MRKKEEEEGRIQRRQQTLVAILSASALRETKQQRPRSSRCVHRRFWSEVPVVSVVGGERARDVAGGLGALLLIPKHLDDEQHSAFFFLKGTVRHGGGATKNGRQLSFTTTFKTGKDARERPLLRHIKTPFSFFLLLASISIESRHRTRWSAHVFVLIYLASLP